MVFTELRIYANVMKNNPEPVKNLPNIGPVLAKELGNVGISTASDLIKIGSAAALYKIKGLSGRGCMNRLFALEGAIRKVRWHKLSKKEKSSAKKALGKIILNKQTISPLIHKR